MFKIRMPIDALLGPKLLDDFVGVDVLISACKCAGQRDQTASLFPWQTAYRFSHST